MVVWWSPPPPHALPPTPSHLPTHPPQILKRIGELFPKGAKATRAYLHAEGDVVASLAAAGWTVTRRHMHLARAGIHGDKISVDEQRGPL